MAMPNQRTPGRAVVQPNTLSGQTQPNTLSTMTGRSAPGRRAVAQASGWRVPAAGTPAAGGSRPGSSVMARVISWVIFLAVAYFLLYAMGR
jgi:hypothetical protein